VYQKWGIILCGNMYCQKGEREEEVKRISWENFLPLPFQYHYFSRILSLTQIQQTPQKPVQDFVTLVEKNPSQIKLDEMVELTNLLEGTNMEQISRFIELGNKSLLALNQKLSKM